jgi:benzoate membrane transport protein
MRLSLISAALVAALVGFGSTIALVLAAAAAVGATPAQTASWVCAVCLAKAAGSAYLSWSQRIPVVLAWSTPGAALIAASSGHSMGGAVAAFILAGGLIFLTGLIGPLGRLISMIPKGIAAAMLGGVLLPFCLKVPAQALALPAVVAPIIGVFLVVRLWNPAFAVLAALGTGLALSWGMNLPAVAFALPALTFIPPVFDLHSLIGLGLPLYLVTMASQNLPGFAVLQTAGYTPPVRPALMVTGGLSALAALFGAHTINMAAITAAICLGDDVHPDRAQRWKVGLAYGFFWLLLGLAGPLILAALVTLPPEVMATVVGLALVNALIGALSAAFADPADRFAAASTLIVTASGFAVLGIGAAFWGLLVGLIIIAGDRVVRRN